MSISRIELVGKMNQLEKEISELDGAYLTCENRGIYVTSLGHAYTANKDRIELKPSNIGYFYVEGKYFTIKDPTKMPRVVDETGTKVPGEYIQNLVVFKMGDAYGKEFTYDLPLDHINMDHSDNRPENLEFVSTLANLYRAMLATDFDQKFINLYAEEFERIINSAESDERKAIIRSTLKDYISTIGRRELNNYIKPKDKKED